jgi:hypothetical protein
MRTSKYSLRKERIESFASDGKSGLPFGSQGRLSVQIHYSRTGNAPTGKVQLWVTTDVSAPYVLARKQDNTPYEFMINQEIDNQAQDIFEFDGAYDQFKLVYIRDAWTDPNPNNTSTDTNWIQFFWATK